MFEFGKHAVFIWGSYGAVLVVLAGVIVWLIGDGRSLARRLNELEARGVSRRSSGAGGQDGL